MSARIHLILKGHDATCWTQGSYDAVRTVQEFLALDSSKQCKSCLKVVRGGRTNDTVKFNG